MPIRDYRRKASAAPSLLYTWRYCLLLLFLFSCALGLIWRLFHLSIVDQAFLRQQSNARIVREVTLPAHRGIISDRNHQPLAISTPVESVWINPQQVKLTSKQREALQHLLSLKNRTVNYILAQNKTREFAYLKRRITPALAAQVKALKIPGVYFQREYRRYYPQSEICAHLIGFTNIDDRGQEGLELTYNTWLQGFPGRKRVIKDRMGQVVAKVGVEREPRPGHNVVLSIDQRIQYLVYQNLLSAMKKYKAQSGTIVVLDVKTGEVLAMVNAPSYNPNRRPKRHDDRYRNRAVTDVFEPGSTMKPFSVANALLSHHYTPTTPVDTAPGWMIVNGKRVEDSHNNHVLDLTGILKKSSNVGISKVTLSLPPDSLWHVLHKVGFGETTGIMFPGESNGTLKHYAHWDPFVLATLSFGYGMSTTALQLASAYAVIADHGVKKPVTLLRVHVPQSGIRVLPRKVADQLIMMLNAVVDGGGSGKRAQIPGYQVAGKTGTARLIGEHGYERHHHRSIFVGFAPASRPELVIAVVVNDPRGWQYYGSLVAAPVFAKVMEGALRILDIPPDKVA